MGAIISILLMIYILVEAIDALRGVGDDWLILLGMAIVFVGVPVFFIVGTYSWIKHLKRSRKFKAIVHTFISESLSSEGMTQIISNFPAYHQWQIACLRDLKTIRESITGALTSEIADVAETWMALLGECHERIRQLGPRRINASIQEEVADLIKKVEKDFYSRVTLNVAKRHLDNAGKLKRKEAKLECLNQAKETLVEGLDEQINGSNEIQRLLNEVINQEQLLIPKTT